jgi:hypothetical protein
MISVRDLIQTEKPYISIRELVNKYPVPSPISIRNLLAPRVFIARGSRELSAGSLTGWAEFTSFSNGRWCYKGHLDSDAMFFSEKYTFSAWPYYVHPSGSTVSVTQSGDIGPRDSNDWEQWGHSLWIAENWEEIVSHGTHFHLHTSASFGWDEFFRIMGTVTAFALMLSPIIAPEDCYYTRDEEGNLGAECRFRVE